MRETVSRLEACHRRFGRWRCSPSIAPPRRWSRRRREGRPPRSPSRQRSGWGRRRHQPLRSRAIPQLAAAVVAPALHSPGAGEGASVIGARRDLLYTSQGHLGLREAARQNQERTSKHDDVPPCHAKTCAPAGNIEGGQEVTTGWETGDHGWGLLNRVWSAGLRCFLNLAERSLDRPRSSNRLNAFALTMQLKSMKGPEFTE